MGGIYHAMTCEIRIGLQNAVGGGIISRCVHSIRASFVEGGRESHISCGEASDGDFRHCRRVLDCEGREGGCEF